MTRLVCFWTEHWRFVAKDTFCLHHVEFIVNQMIITTFTNVAFVFTLTGCMEIPNCRFGSKCVVGFVTGVGAIPPLHIKTEKTEPMLGGYSVLIHGESGMGMQCMLDPPSGCILQKAGLSRSRFDSRNFKINSVSQWSCLFKNNLFSLKKKKLTPVCLLNYLWLL